MDHPYLNVSDPVFTRRLHHVTYGVMAPLLVTTGIFGNLVCLPCLVAPRRWGVTRFFLVVLSSADTSIMLSLIPTLVRLAAPTEIVDAPALATYAAHVEQWLLTTTMCVSIGTVLALTIDRYISVCRYTEFKRTHRRSQAHYRIVVVAVLAVALGLPWLFNSSREAQADGWVVSYEQTGGWKAYIVFCEIVTRLVPMLVLVLLNWRVVLGFREMLARAEDLHPPPASQQREASVASVASMPKRFGQKEAAEERQLIRLVVAIMVALVVGLLPAAVTACCLMFADQPTKALDVATAVANLLEIANFSTNYLFYLLFNKRLRKSLVEFYRNLVKPQEAPIAIVNT